MALRSAPVVAVVGGGFSGLLTALHLVADPTGPQVRLIERRDSFGRGLAYSTGNTDHVLNVRAGGMSAFPDDPDHFRRWLAERGDAQVAQPFVARGVYGDYLQSLLRSAVDGAFGTDRLLLEFDEVVDLRPAGEGWTLLSAMGREIAADAVVLALGALSPLTPRAAGAALLASPRYVADPWARGGLPDDLGDEVLLLGAGLTMVDAAISLARPGRRLTAISRRGLLPRGHAEASSAPAVDGPGFKGSPAALLRRIRALSAQRDWREVIDEVRLSVRAVWGSWSRAQRRSFLRHLRPWWDVHRHRMAPPVAGRIEDLQAAGGLTVHAGAIEGLELAADKVRVAWRPRGRREAQVFTVDAVVNCTGGHGDIRLSDPGLLRAMLTRDLVRPDACGLGIEVDGHSRPLSPEGAPTPALFAVGPLTRGAFWEITSVPDIRRQAQGVAADVAALLTGGAAAIARGG